jgi:hypothetical protein
MRAIYSVVLLTALATSASGLTACSNFDPDKLDIFGLNEKKKLPGERKDVFPGGVPGVTQGIPPEYMRSNQAPPETAQAPAPAQAKEAAAGEEEKAPAAEPEEKPKPKPKRVAKPKTQPQPAQATAQPSAQQAQSPWPAPAQTNTASPWPSSPQPGTFQR